jgi:hypothetical protein
MNANMVTEKSHAENKNRLRREVLKLSNTVHKHKVQLKLEKLSTKGYVQQCNLLFNAFIKRLDQFYPDSFLKAYYKEAFPLEDTQQNFQLKIQILSEAYQSFEITKDVFERDILNLIHCFTKVLEGKPVTFE